MAEIVLCLQTDKNQNRKGNFKYRSVAADVDVVVISCIIINIMLMVDVAACCLM
jgi:preprotein translocase subunit Sec63